MAPAARARSAARRSAIAPAPGNAAIRSHIPSRKAWRWSCTRKSTRADSSSGRPLATSAAALPACLAASAWRADSENSRSCAPAPSLAASSRTWAMASARAVASAMSCLFSTTNNGRPAAPAQSRISASSSDSGPSWLVTRMMASACGRKDRVVRVLAAIEEPMPGVSMKVKPRRRNSAGNCTSAIPTPR